jgi:hypothetical protein
MFDAETAALIRTAPALRGVDPQTLPQELTAIYVELAGLRLRAQVLQVGLHRLAPPRHLLIRVRLRRRKHLGAAVLQRRPGRALRRRAQHGAPRLGQPRSAQHRLARAPQGLQSVQYWGSRPRSITMITSPR